MGKIDLKDVNQRGLLDGQGPNVYLYYKGTESVTITSGVRWYTRLWYMISNPFRYLFAGRWRF